MGKRLVRIFEKDLKKQIDKLIGLELNVVLKNKTTIHGVLNQFEDNHLKIKDLLHRNHTIAIEKVEEIVFDKTSAY